MKNVDKNVLARTVVLFVLLINQVLIMFGLNPLPFSEQEIYEAVTGVMLAITAVVTWWENNSFTDEAKKADQYMKELKADKKEGKQ